jgi:nicotinate-nucleotide adenylyltransferase
MRRKKVSKDDGMRRPAPNPWGGRARRRVGLLGGSFNPAHEGHLHISFAALRALDLDEVWWLVSPQNPLKPEEGMASLADRFDSALVVARHPRLRVSEIEVHLGTRYTADTLKVLQRRFPNTQFVWLMGADNLAQIDKWRHWLTILTRVPVAVLDRSPYSYKALVSKAARRFAGSRIPARRATMLADAAPPAWTFIHQRRHPASATAIRAQARRPARTRTP